MLSQPVMTTESLAEFFRVTKLNEFEFAVILQLIPSMMCQHLVTVLKGLRGTPGRPMECCRERALLFASHGYWERHRATPSTCRVPVEQLWALEHWSCSLLFSKSIFSPKRPVCLVGFK